MFRGGRAQRDKWWLGGPPRGQLEERLGQEHKRCGWGQVAGKGWRGLRLGGHRDLTVWDPEG